MSNSQDTTRESSDAPDKPAERIPERTSERQADKGSRWLTIVKGSLGLLDRASLRESMEAALREDENTSAEFKPQEREMLRRMLRFGTLRVDDVMVPRADIIGIDEQQPLSDLLQVFREAGHSRVPLYRDTLDDLRGMVHIKDFLSWIVDQALHHDGASKPQPVTPANDESDDEPVNHLGVLDNIRLDKVDLSRPIHTTKLRRQVMFVPPSMPAINLFLRMQSTRAHMALVVDEYGGTDGLVSIEDLVEEVVGNIEDEHDDDTEQMIQEHPRLGIVASGRAPIDQVESYLGRTLLNGDEEEEIDTLGGLVFARLGRVPVRGEVVRHPAGVELEILDADARRVKKLRIIVRRSGKSGTAPVISSSTPQSASTLRPASTAAAHSASSTPKADLLKADAERHSEVTPTESAPAPQAGTAPNVQPAIKPVAPSLAHSSPVPASEITRSKGASGKS